MIYDLAFMHVAMYSQAMHLRLTNCDLFHAVYVGAVVSIDCPP